MNKWVPKWVIPLLVILSVGTVWLRLTIVQTTYELNQANKIQHSLKLDKEKLDLKLATLRSPRNLEQLAKKFNLKAPTSERIIRMTDSK